MNVVFLWAWDLYVIPSQVKTRREDLRDLLAVPQQEALRCHSRAFVTGHVGHCPKCRWPPST